ncbi:iron-containing alcohol dehydrogenase family protein [Oceanobacillus salinisoli]|uniref:iron-containing alcohol dehydrogenase family protein n=1 Tax=Oceanobacillus salinisoli TaxID=2678611 RepID=UPI0012E0E396|nr:iron-containing alcohol dehydrogenase family protein [Oceanobacillus salinisoli]
METISIHGAPSEYVLQEGILQQLEVKLLDRGFSKILVVHGKKSWEAAQSYWPTLSEIESVEYSYNGECSLSEIEKVSKVIMEEVVDAVIGVGGGKILDLVKSSCHQTHTPFVLIPTLASNCSPWTPISVIYDDTGAFVRFDLYPKSASLVLIEPQILLHVPLNMLIAGIGDTLAKWYEADVQIGAMKQKQAALEISHYTAKLCKDYLLNHSERAIEAARTGILNEDFIKVAETIIMIGGMVGGFGDHYGRVAGAHANHNGLTVLEETHYALHGEKVAYGILVQLVLEDKWKEIDKILPFYQKINLPSSLKNLGVETLDEEKLMQAAEKAVVPEETIHILPGEISEESVVQAMLKLEEKIRLLSI